ncbi:ring-cleaving dioxygenase [Secundilactobacillus kimchicus]|uniref:Glyoxalase family protein n=1 Tax=Secundilactobacillus kimchicus JCM 15530 TaxID=1302272 RepID=A0A0R1HVX9_9LACO|nr:ring-cleaving dioxygenase [Secundilactobacillus kimchicus]KRK47649.1 glyoxalase family protein [Secundilactobacillus kimchicus JCM 15530]MBT9672163.1 ring-cleaving dioxygenase [Secundilactobacillus kimchicus]
MEKTDLFGLHHITAITSSSPKMFQFMTEVLGLHLIKKTVNQDDVRTYHLYFTDDMGTAGTDLTFFDFPGIGYGKPGKNTISRIGFRVPSDAALDYWANRFTEFNIDHDSITDSFGAKVLRFYDFDNQRYQLVSDEHNHGLGGGTPYRKSPVASDFAISGLGPTVITVSQPEPLEKLLIDLMGFEKVAKEASQTLYELHNGGHGAQVIVETSLVLPDSVQGYGTVHHMAFRTQDQETLNYWINRIRSFGLSDSGFVDRFYFASEYFQVAPGVLFEIATDGPGFLQDETYEEAGVHLELPPFLEEYRDRIEANLVPFNTEANANE